MYNYDFSIGIGYDPVEKLAYDALIYTIDKYARKPIKYFPIDQDELRKEGLYNRPIDKLASNSFSVTRNSCVLLADTDYVLFIDLDMIFTGCPWRLFDYIDKKELEEKAVIVVKHDYIPKSLLKMDGQTQTPYPRKQWSSCVLWNRNHPKVKENITWENINSKEPRWFHRFEFLNDNEIGEFYCWVDPNKNEDIPSGFEKGRSPLVNFLVGEIKPPKIRPLLIHYTLNIPSLHSDWDDDYSKEFIDLVTEVKFHQRLEKLERTL